MKMRTFLSVTAATAALGAFGFAADASAADNIVLNQWYAGQFTGTPSPLFGGGTHGTNGPVLPSGFANGISAPGSLTTPGSWTITLAGAGTLTVTDVENSGDQFKLFDNGVAMTPAASPFTAAGQNSGQAGLAGGLTSVPAFGDNVGEDINAALGDANFSSGTFALSAGTNVITGTFLGSVGFGDMDFIAESGVPIPEPATWALMLMGLGGVGAALRMRRRILLAVA